MAKFMKDDAGKNARNKKKTYHHRKKGPFNNPKT